MNKVINWKQFKVKDAKPNLISGWDIFTFTGNNKPNLIENGWDDFEPYGSGKNYVENWNFESDDLSGWNGVGSSVSQQVINGSYCNVTEKVQANNRFEYVVPLPKGNYVFRCKIKSNYNIALRNWSGVSFDSSVVEKSEKFKVVEISFVVDDEGIKRIRFYLDAHLEGVDLTQKTFIDWIQITPVDNQHLVVEKTPLENGLTRIQTWGGNNDTKLRFVQNSSNVGEDLNISFYVKNNGEDIVLTHDAESSNDTIPKQYEGVFQNTTSVSVGGYAYVGITSKGNLDFIVGDPELVMSKYPNIKVSMNQENTLMHIKTFGGNDKRKLYGTIGRFPSGTRFQQSIYIENYGPDVYVSGHTGTVERHKIETGYKGWMHFPAWVDGPSWMDFSFGAETPDECLNFKCTLPQIVEGDVPNPELIIQTLDDGREHVRVFGANPDTKLVYDEAGFKGELYSFETEIENQGTHLKMTSTVGDYDKEIGEGTTEVKQAGNLASSKLTFEIGASDE